jgi:hypothetical protein
MAPERADTNLKEQWHQSGTRARITEFDRQLGEGSHTFVEATRIYKLHHDDDRALLPQVGYLTALTNTAIRPYPGPKWETSLIT